MKPECFTRESDYSDLKLGIQANLCVKTVFVSAPESASNKALEHFGALILSELVRLSLILNSCGILFG